MARMVSAAAPVRDSRYYARAVLPMEVRPDQPARPLAPLTRVRPPANRVLRPTPPGTRLPYIPAPDGYTYKGRDQEMRLRIGAGTGWEPTPPDARPEMASARSTVPSVQVLGASVTNPNYSAAGRVQTAGLMDTIRDTAAGIGRGLSDRYAEEQRRRQAAADLIGGGTRNLVKKVRPYVGGPSAPQRPVGGRPGGVNANPGSRVPRAPYSAPRPISTPKPMPTTPNRGAQPPAMTQPTYRPPSNPFAGRAPYTPPPPPPAVRVPTPQNNTYPVAPVPLSAEDLAALDARRVNYDRALGEALAYEENERQRAEGQLAAQMRQLARKDQRDRFNVFSELGSAGLARSPYQAGRAARDLRESLAGDQARARNTVADHLAAIAERTSGARMRREEGLAGIERDKALLGSIVNRLLPGVAY